ncbi:MAG: YciI family protein [Microbacteriaceae bacterium]
MSKYLILIFQDEATATTTTGETMSAEHQAFMQKYQASLLGGAGLEPTSTATSLRRDASGGFTVTDGPFAESKEALGGYYLIEAADLDEALQVAKAVPAGIGVEVRPVWMAS